jgi:hypothetical protein
MGGGRESATGTPFVPRSLSGNWDGGTRWIGVSVVVGLGRTVAAVKNWLEFGGSREKRYGPFQ